ncbi:hypothetical protein ACTHGU_20350 [Chitinophagaceae bacterium MMS25-I14]
MKKNWITCIILLLVSAGKSLGCGPYYPFGEDVRFTLFSNIVPGYDDYSYFMYSAQLFCLKSNSTTDTASKYGADLNVQEWQRYCKGNVSAADVYRLLYEMDADLELLGPDTVTVGNGMVRWLHSKGDTAAISYLRFAKSCELFNSFDSDPWEHNENAWVPKRAAMINEALTRIKTTKREELKLRYAFLAIRMAFYNTDTRTVKDIWGRYFQQHKKAGIIDYWAMHFRAMVEADKPLCNYYAARVFANAPDKRFEIYQQYNKSVPLAAVLRYAKNSRERAEIYAMNAFKNPGKALSDLEQVYRLAPHSRMFSVLLQRETDKLEDWIYTPYYTNFLPSLEDESYEFFRKDDAPYLLARRVAKDRAYAGKLLQFMERVNIPRTENPLLCKTAKAHLHLMKQDYTGCLREANTIVRNTPAGNDFHDRARMIAGLCLVARQPAGKARLSLPVKQLMLEEQKNKRFRFAVARELEYKGNTTTAALILSKIAPDKDYDMWDEEGSSQVYWRSHKGHNTLLEDFYDNYFYYLDAQYTPAQLQQLITNANGFNTARADSFDKWLYSGIEGVSISRLYDLLGTKYIRENKLDDALRAFQKVNDTLWTSVLYKGYRYLDANPFYENLYSEHERKAEDSIKFNKRTITAQLISYLKQAEDVHSKERDKAFFLVANCYLNMTQYGNSWMMRRYFWTTNEVASKLPDDDEYFNCNLAKRYYLKAKSVTRNRKFGALCLRMAGRCEKYRLYYARRDAGWNDYDHLTDSLFAANRYYRQLKRQYPDCYDDLIDNCTVFERYFAAAQ